MSNAHIVEQISKIDSELTKLDSIMLNLAREREQLKARLREQSEKEVTVIRRVVSECGHKAITIAFKMVYECGVIQVGVSDSGSAKQYSKAEGVAVAKSRVGMLRLVLGKQSPATLLSDMSLVSILCYALSCDNDYDSLSKALRPFINHRNGSR